MANFKEFPYNFLERFLNGRVSLFEGHNTVTFIVKMIKLIFNFNGPNAVQVEDSCDVVGFVLPGEQQPKEFSKALISFKSYVLNNIRLISLTKESLFLVQNANTLQDHGTLNLVVIFHYKSLLGLSGEILMRLARRDSSS